MAASGGVPRSACSGMASLSAVGPHILLHVPERVLHIEPAQIGHQHRSEARFEARFYQEWTGND